MIIRDKLLELLDCREVFEVPEKMLDYLLSDKQTEFLSNINALYGDKSVDQFRDFFQEEQADRKKLKQDYTPGALSELLARLLPSGESLADVCSGTGSLAIHYLTYHEDVKFIRCEEFSTRVIPFLLVNLSLRKIEAEVIHGNSLTGERFAVYHINPDGFISKIEQPSDRQVDVVVSNPPYSMPWEPPKALDDRFADYGLAPKSKADFAFLLHAFSQLKQDGELGIILPHGVLFRGNQEKAIRTRLLEKSELKSVIGLPNNLFLNASIPVAILILKKGRQDDGVLFIDASGEFEKQKAQNLLAEEHLEKIIGAYKLNTFIERFANRVSFKEIADNDHNLNIPRYVDTFIPEPVRPLSDIYRELLEVERELAQVDQKIMGDLSKLEATHPQDVVELEESKHLFAQITGQKIPKRKEANRDQLSLF